MKSSPSRASRITGTGSRQIVRSQVVRNQIVRNQILRSQILRSQIVRLLKRGQVTHRQLEDGRRHAQQEGIEVDIRYDKARRYVHLPTELLLMIFNDCLYNEEINVVPDSHQRFRETYSVLRSVCPRFDRILRDAHAMPALEAVYVFQHIQSLFYMPKLSPWLGIPAPSDLTRSMRHISLRQSGAWYTVMLELDDWSEQMDQMAHAIDTIELQWRPSLKKFTASKHESHLSTVSERFPGFKSQSMSIRIGDSSVTLDITLVRA